MKKISVAVSAAFLLLATNAMAATTVVEGADAKKLYDAEKATSNVLVQKDKNFILRAGGTETPKPTEMKVKAGQRFYIANEEGEFVHNVYDETDAGWVLKKQEPAGIAAISFDKAGEHNLRCAIHPQMKIKVIVE